MWYVLFSLHAWCCAYVNVQMHKYDVSWACYVSVEGNNYDIIFLSPKSCPCPYLLCPVWCYLIVSLASSRWVQLGQAASPPQALPSHDGDNFWAKFYSYIHQRQRENFCVRKIIHYKQIIDSVPEMECCHGQRFAGGGTCCASITPTAVNMCEKTYYVATRLLPMFVSRDVWLMWNAVTECESNKEKVTVSEWI